MAYCKNCGSMLEEGQKFCKECGQAVNDEVAIKKEDRSNDIVMGILAYIGILVLIPLFAAKDSKFARFHTNQGLILLILEVAVIILSSVLIFIPIIGWLINIALWLVSLALLAFSIIGIINVANYVEKEIPIVGGFQILK